MLTGGVVTIYVGPKRKEYQIHKGLLASNEYWSKYLDSKLAEDSQIVHLAQDCPEDWDLFINWLYRGSLKHICAEDRAMEETQAYQYALLYIKAEEWAIPALQNKIMDKLRAWSTSVWDYYPYYLTRRIYERTPRDSPLRSYLVDGFLSKSSLENADCEYGEQLKSQLDYGNQEFVLECFEALMQLTPKAKLRAADRKSACTYHKHEDGKKCSK